MHIIEKPWALVSDAVLKQLDVDHQGLTESMVVDRHTVYGYNRLQEIPPKNAWAVLWNQLKSLLVFLLLAAAIASFAFHEILEGYAIIAVIVINAMIGFFMEIRAVRSMEALKKMGGISAKVRRNGQVIEIHSENLVPGDIVVIEGGDWISADMRIITSSRLQANESTLTGESEPVDKFPDTLSESTPLADRKNMLFQGTALTRGSGEAVVVFTGMETELGKISEMIQHAEEESTPLEKRLNRLSQSLLWVTLIIAVIVAVSGILSGKEMLLMIETAIALAVAAIPEGLPIVATIALARGMIRMARQNALVRKLSAVETLGATTIIFTDKTGTLTQNRMTVTKIVLNSGTVDIRYGAFFKSDWQVTQMDYDLRTAIETGVLCNNASLSIEPVEGSSSEVGDPMEIALLQAAKFSGMDIDHFRESHPELEEHAFDSDTKRMATVNRFDKTMRISIKGAMDSVIDDCTQILDGGKPRPWKESEKQKWIEDNNRLGSEGLRVIALAMKEGRTQDKNPYDKAVFVGLLGIQDPPREDAKAAIEACRKSGIRVIMITGDQPVTAKNIADRVGLTQGTSGKVLHSSKMKPLDDMSELEQTEVLDTPVFARVTPSQKLDLITLYQKQGHIVAMTGDGVNDAPALKKADIGVAMGLRGTQVAQEAADMVLKDDAFATIVKAIEQGRIIFGNIQKAVKFLLSCNISEVMAVGLAAVVNAPLPILPLQILFINLVTDVFPALALSMGKGDSQIMKKPPRSPKEPILGRKEWREIVGFGILMTASVLGVLAYSMKVMHLEYAVAGTISFLTLGFNQLWHVFNMRERGSGFLRNEVTRNPMIWGALAICAGILVTAVYLPGLSDVLKLVHPGPAGWGLVLAASSIPWIAGQIYKSVPLKRKTGTIVHSDK